MQLHHRSRSKRSISKTYRLVNIFLLVPFFGSKIQSLSKILNCLVNILIPHIAKKKCCLHPSNSCLLAGKSYFLLFLGATADLKCLNNTSSSCHIKNNDVIPFLKLCAVRSESSIDRQCRDLLEVSFCGIYVCKIKIKLSLHWISHLRYPHINCE